VNTWLRRIRAALVMGVIWALVWMPIGPVLGAILDPDGAMDEPWIAVGTFPGFLAGVMFSVVLGIAARRRKLDELSVAKVGGWGTVAGLIVGSIPFLMGDQNPNIQPAWMLPLVVISSITVLSTVSAATAFALARKAARQELPAAHDDVSGSLPR
jgi:hypothetical protein